jgi:hypothetical protein
MLDISHTNIKLACVVDRIITVSQIRSIYRSAPGRSVDSRSSVMSHEIVPQSLRIGASLQVLGSRGI